MGSVSKEKNNTDRLIEARDTCRLLALSFAVPANGVGNRSDIAEYNELNERLSIRLNELSKIGFVPNNYSGANSCNAFIGSSKVSS